MPQEDANTSGSVAGSLSSSKLGADQSSDSVVKSTEPRGRSTNTGADAVELNEGRKGRKPKKGKSAEKDSEAGQEPEIAVPPPKVELSEAPIPTVNVWVQRREAAKAKTSDQPLQATAAALSGFNPTQASTDSKAPSTHSETMDSSRLPFNGKQISKRDGEISRNGTNHGPKRAAPRGARVQDKEAEMNLLANNSASWPTPETAAVNTKTQPQKPAKEDKEDAGASKSKRRNEWTQFPGDFVPSVKFETTLPGRGSRGGRVSGRGGRDANGNNQPMANSTGKALSTHALVHCAY
jgi:la-related protein 1